MSEKRDRWLCTLLLLEAHISNAWLRSWIAAYYNGVVQPPSTHIGCSSNIHICLSRVRNSRSDVPQRSACISHRTSTALHRTSAHFVLQAVGPRRACPWPCFSCTPWAGAGLRLKRPVRRTLLSSAAILHGWGAADGRRWPDPVAGFKASARSLPAPPPPSPLPQLHFHWQICGRG